MPKLISQKNFSNIETYYEETSSTDEAVIDSFSKNRFRSVKYQVQVTTGSDHHTTEILLVHDGAIVYLTEYGTILTDDSLATFSAGIVGNNVRLLATPASATTSKFRIIRTGINNS